MSDSALMPAALFASPPPLKVVEDYLKVSDISIDRMEDTPHTKSKRRSNISELKGTTKKERIALLFLRFIQPHSVGTVYSAANDISRSDNRNNHHLFQFYHR